MEVISSLISDSLSCCLPEDLEKGIKQERMIRRKKSRIRTSKRATKYKLNTYTCDVTCQSRIKIIYYLSVFVCSEYDKGEHQSKLTTTRKHLVKIKRLMELGQFAINHCYMEINNQVADTLANLGVLNKFKTIFNTAISTPSQVKAAMKMDRMNMPTTSSLLMTYYYVNILLNETV